MKPTEALKPIGITLKKMREHPSITAAAIVAVATLGVYEMAQPIPTPICTYNSPNNQVICRGNTGPFDTLPQVEPLSDGANSFTSEVKPNLFPHRYTIILTPSKPNGVLKFKVVDMNTLLRIEKSSEIVNAPIDNVPPGQPTASFHDGQIDFKFPDNYGVTRVNIDGNTLIPDSKGNATIAYPKPKKGLNVLKGTNIYDAAHNTTKTDIQFNYQPQLPEFTQFKDDADGNLVITAKILNENQLNINSIKITGKQNANPWPFNGIKCSTSVSDEQMIVTGRCQRNDKTLATQVEVNIKDIYGNDWTVSGVTEGPIGSNDAQTLVLFTGLLLGSGIISAATLRQTKAFIDRKRKENNRKLSMDIINIAAKPNVDLSQSDVEVMDDAFTELFRDKSNRHQLVNLELRVVGSRLDCPENGQHDLTTSLKHLTHLLSLGLLRQQQEDIRNRLLIKWVSYFIKTYEQDVSLLAKTGQLTEEEQLRYDKLFTNVKTLSQLPDNNSICQELARQGASQELLCSCLGDDLVDRSPRKKNN